VSEGRITVNPGGFCVIKNEAAFQYRLPQSPSTGPRLSHVPQAALGLGDVSSDTRPVIHNSFQQESFPLRDPPGVVDARDQRPLLFLAEGGYDVCFLKAISRILAASSPSLPDLGRLSDRGELIFIPVGGTPRGWSHLFAPLNLRELHLIDRESPPESALRHLAADRVNQRPNCLAMVTTPRSVEGYLHREAITAASGGRIRIQFGLEDCVPSLVARARNDAESSTPWTDLLRSERARRAQKAKRWLNTVAVEYMTPELLRESDPTGDLTRLLEAVNLMRPGGERRLLDRATHGISCHGRPL